MYKLLKYSVLLSLYLGSVASWAQQAPPVPQPTPPVTPVKAEKTPPAAKKSGSSESLSAYNMKLRELEEKVVGLKEKIFKSKTRLLLLKEQILHNVIAEARAVIIHNNDMGPSFTLEQVLYYLDNDKIYYQDNKDDVVVTSGKPSLDGIH